jgi:hypothetical protein
MNTRDRKRKGERRIERGRDGREGSAGCDIEVGNVRREARDVCSYLSWSEGTSWLLDRLAVVRPRLSKASTGDRKALWERDMIVPCRARARARERTCGECFSKHLPSLDGSTFVYILQTTGHMAMQAPPLSQLLGDDKTCHVVCRRIETCSCCGWSPTRNISAIAILPSSLDCPSPHPHFRIHIQHAIGHRSTDGGQHPSHLPSRSRCPLSLYLNSDTKIAQAAWHANDCAQCAHARAATCHPDQAIARGGEVALADQGSPRSCFR